jgi:hypothetical protein
MKRIREAGLTQEQAEAIASLPEERYLTRDYFDAARQADRDQLDARMSQLDAKLAQLETSLTWRIAGIAGLVIVLVGLIDKFVRP